MEKLQLHILRIERTVLLGEIMKSFTHDLISIASYDFVEIYVGQRLVRRLSGGDDDDDDKDDDNKKADYDDDDDCDDDDLDDLDDIDDDEEDGVLTIHGTGEMIRILFRSDYSVTRRGFFVRYKIASPQLPAVGEWIVDVLI